jgi:hypothetical protein
LRVFEIEELTPDKYRQTLCWSVHPPIGEHGRHGIHNIDGSTGVIVYDAYTMRFTPFAWLYRIRERWR